jgi:monoterpene epsilon-lactone hydrolase
MHVPRPLVVAASRPMYRIGLHHRMPARIGRRILNAGGYLMPVPDGTSVRHVVIGGRHAERVTVGASQRPRAVLYLHGGGYSVGSARLYRSCAAYLAQASNAVVFTLDYRLAPEHPYPAAVDDAVAAFRDLVSVHGFEPSRIAIAGDSAGGGLSVATAHVLADEGLHPAALALLSPWTDPVDESFTRQRDLVTNVRWGRMSAALYRGTADARDPGYAPMHGRLDDLPPMLIQCSTVEMLYPQILRFASLVEQAGGTVTVDARDDWWHAHQVLAGTLRAATEAVREVGAFLRDEFSLVHREGLVVST